MSKIRFPAEWEPHRATWIAWPYSESDFPGKVETVQWVYTEIVRILSAYEKVEIVCHSEELKTIAEEQLSRLNIRGDFRFHIQPTNRNWLRDSAPTGVFLSDGSQAWVNWQFTAWAKFPDYQADQKIPGLVSQISERKLIEAMRPDNNQRIVLEGGAFDCDGAGTLLVTEECLLSVIQERNRGLTREGYEQVFAQYLGIKKTIWLGAGCEGDTTHGHVDDIARFIAPGKIALTVERDPSDPNCATSLENLARLQDATDADGRNLEIIELPFPHRMEVDGLRSPASYGNFYIANGVVIVPTYNDPNDVIALTTLQKHFTDRKVVGIYCGDLVLGEGTLHCLTQQEPK